MDLTGWLVRRTPPRPLLVAAPGAASVRLAVERVVRERSWWPAVSPAEANLLVECGTPGPHLADAVETVWQLLPLPRHRVRITDAARADPDLLAALATLRHPPAGDSHQPTHQHAHHQDDVPSAGASAAQVMDHHGDGNGDRHGHGGHHECGNHTDHDQGEHGGQGEHAGHAGHDAHHDPGGHDMHHDGGHDVHDGTGGHDMHHGHGGHGMHGEMEMPGGIPMADRGADRDGLTLDQLHVALGPVLPDWPAGLVVRVVLQGDVIQDATVELLDAGAGGTSPFPWLGSGARTTGYAAWRLDGLSRLLRLAGWPRAERFAVLRDRLLDGDAASEVAMGFEGEARRVRRSRTLAWSLRGLGRADHPDDELGGDVLDRLHRMLDTVDGALRGEPVPAEVEAVRARVRRTVDVLPGLLVGAELAGARLIVASVEPDVELLAAAVARG